MIFQCVDASVSVKWAVEDAPFRMKAHDFLKDAGIYGIKFIAPPNFLSETDSAINKRIFDGRISVIEARKAYRILDTIPVEIINSFDARQRAREIAKQFNQRFVYDANYAGLAELYNCEFWTAGKAFYNAVKTELKYVRYLPDYSKAKY